jgi:hypothetical protein
MTERGATKLRKTKKIFYFILSLSTILIVGLPGCEEKAQAPYSVLLKKVVGTCEVFDKLPSGISKPVEVNFGNKVKLLGISVNKESQSRLKMSYYWQILEDPTPYNAAFVLLIAKDDNNQVMGNDHYLCQNHPFGELKGKFVKETSTVVIADSAVGKKIDVGIGIFGPELKTNSRLKITSAGKTPIIDNNTCAIVEELNL